MSSVSSTSAARQSGIHSAPSDVLRWRSWPLVDHRRWSWVVLVGITLIGLVAGYLTGHWLAGMAAAAVVSIGLWQYLLPTSYEIYVLGLRRHVLGRTRVVPWHAVRAYRPLSTGIVLYQHPDPSAIDALRSLFIPYPADEDEIVCALREHLGHAVELP